MRRVSALRVLALMLAVVMVLSAWVPSARATEQEKTLYFSTSIEGVNPLYASEAPFVETEEEEPPVHITEDLNDAVKVLRKVMKAREPAATLFVPVEINSSFSDYDALGEELSDYAMAILNGALAHTGKGDEGDYLRYTYYKHNVSLTLWGNGENTELEVTFRFVYHTTAQQEAELSDFLSGLLSTWHLENASDYEKVCAVYDWLCENVTYADPIPDAPSTAYAAYGAVMEWSSVCQGYATALYRMLLDLGVDCRVISGIGVDNNGNDGPHAWNIVELGDRYYNADATWDAVWLAAGQPYAWFLTSDDHFSFHYRDQEYKTESFYAAYPMAQEDYDPSTQETPEPGAGVTWELTDDGTLIISGNGDMEAYDVLSGVYAPWTYYHDSIKKIVVEEGVTSIGYGAFALCDRVTEVVIPDGVTKIGAGAFLYCLSLTDIAIPDSVSSVDACAFAGAGLTEIPALGNVTTIPYGAFMECLAMTDVTIPQNVTAIDQMAFSNCQNLQRIEITENVTSVENYVFAGCNNLQSIYFYGDAPEFTGNSIFEMVEATAYYPAGNDTWTEAAMQDYGGSITWVPYGQENLRYTFMGSSVSLGESLFFHIFLDEADVRENDYAVITRTYADGREYVSDPITYEYWSSLEDGTLYLSYLNLAAKEMGDTVSVTFYNQYGDPVSETYTDSIRNYAMRMLEKESDPELLTLLVDMLNYGAEAQKHFGYDTENLVNDELTETQKGYATAAYEAVDMLEAGPGRAATALTLGNWISLDFFFDCGVTGTDFANLKVVVAYTSHNGGRREALMNSECFEVSEGNRFCVSEILTVADYGQAVSCTVYDAEGNAIAWATDSISGYVARMEGKIPEMVSAIAKFGTSAYQYFH